MKGSEFRWFFFRGRFHALNKEEAKPISLCGLSPAGTLRTRVHDAHTMTIPDDICSRCLTRVMVETTDDEPLEECRDRGFVASKYL